ncbi:hypothetical protein [Bifidobacterium avesanii]|uniref:hypothetical protein n=1 Tax=Bifidobacterium avesanii TaxID=1798157 RepID=UPI0013CF79F9|nr:hypothetical protein [Bifidobacterium avesanii]
MAEAISCLIATSFSIADMCTIQHYVTGYKPRFMRRGALFDMGVGPAASLRVADCARRVRSGCIGRCAGIGA